MLKFAVTLLSLLWLTRLPAAEPLRFNRDIRPILSEYCFHCHGPDSSQRQADLRLDLYESTLANDAIVPGKPESSELVARIFAIGEDEVMPPAGSRKRLTLGQKETLKRWILEGAEYELHWAFEAPHKSELPQFSHSDFAIVNPIDVFVQARLIREGLAPSPSASKEALIRRVTLDLTGLPPTLEEIDAFLQDGTDGAYDKVVDRLLASVHYGERMAVGWLDATRYADTNGYQVDRDRELWPWRDWVIRAFNDNKPFDQFTIEQLAGDLLPEATIDQRIATGFHRNHMLNEEGGVIAEEFLAEYTADRVETTAAVWLGLTFNCARCHDHKFDPITQRDFYSMKAFFHNVPEVGVGVYANPIRRNAPPFLSLPSPEVEAKIASLNTELQTVDGELSALVERYSAGIEDWAVLLRTEMVKWEPTELQSESGCDLGTRFDAVERQVENDASRDHEPSSEVETYKFRARLPVGHITALQLKYSAAMYEAVFKWCELTVTSSPPLVLRAVSVGDSLAVAEATKLLDVNSQTCVAVALKPRSEASVDLQLETSLDLEAPLEIEITISLANVCGDSQWSLFSSQTPTELLAPASVLAIARTPVDQRSAEEKQQFLDFRLAQQVEYRRLREAADALRNQIATAEADVPTTLVMEEMKEPRATFVLLRGAYDRLGETVFAAAPAVLPKLDDGLPNNRLGLAKWLMSQRNPLTSRVVVNRYWQHFFGTGFVSTSEDFGAQGEPPTHPELFDWLAATFRDGGWDVKRLLRMIVTSATYRQQAHVTAELLSVDPDNRYLARGPKYRLMAEFVRDQALAASGLLVTQIGGPSVKPYHPPGIYEQLTAGKGNNIYVPGRNAELYRRSLYTY